MGLKAYQVKRKVSSSTVALSGHCCKILPGPTVVEFTKLFIFDRAFPIRPFNYTRKQNLSSVRRNIQNIQLYSKKFPISNFILGFIQFRNF